MQALVRIAKLNYKALGPDTSLDRLFKESILPTALTPKKDDIRTKIAMDANVAKVLNLYRGRLYKLYLLYSSRGRKGPDQIVPCIAIKEFDRMCVELGLLELGQVKKVCFQQWEDPTGVAGAEPVAIPPPADTDEVTFTEFVEGLIRLAVHKMPDQEQKDPDDGEEAEVVEPIRLCLKIEDILKKMFPTPTNKRTRKVRTAFIGFRPEQ